MLQGISSNRRGSYEKNITNTYSSHSCYCTVRRDDEFITNQEVVKTVLLEGERECQREY